MKIAANIVGGLLGLLFIAISLMVLLKMAPIPELEEGTPVWHFMTAFAPTGYLTFVKSMELLGGILVVIPRTRNFGLLILGPIIINIAAFHTFVAGDQIWRDPMILFIAGAALFLLWSGRQKFLALVN